MKKGTEETNYKKDESVVGHNDKHNAIGNDEIDEIVEGVYGMGQKLSGLEEISERFWMTISRIDNGGAKRLISG